MGKVGQFDRNNYLTGQIKPVHSIKSSRYLCDCRTLYQVVNVRFKHGCKYRVVDEKHPTVAETPRSVIVICPDNSVSDASLIGKLHLHDPAMIPKKHDCTLIDTTYFELVKVDSPVPGYLHALVHNRLKFREYFFIYPQ